MKKIYSTENRVTIYLLKSKLEEQGILCTIKNENPPLAGEITPIIAWPELWILDAEQDIQAKNIIQEELSKSSEPQKNWQCSHCGECLEGQFNICWKCGASKV